MAKYCSKCGSLLEDAAVFCSECGEPTGDVIPVPQITQVQSISLPQNASPYLSNYDVHRHDPLPASPVQRIFGIIAIAIMVASFLCSILTKSVLIKPANAISKYFGKESVVSIVQVIETEEKAASKLKHWGVVDDSDLSPVRNIIFVLVGPWLLSLFFWLLAMLEFLIPRKKDPKFLKKTRRGWILMFVTSTACAVGSAFPMIKFTFNRTAAKLLEFRGAYYVYPIASAAVMILSFIMIIVFTGLIRKQKKASVSNIP